MGPVARIKLGTRAALRRKYGYAALRVLRRSLRVAVAAHRAAQVSARSYSTGRAELADAYSAALKRLRKRWPRLDLSDERAKP